MSTAVVIAIPVTATGEREVLGLDVGPSEDGGSGLRSFAAWSRGLKGVLLVTSDSHQGLKDAIAATLTGASWQRCRVHFMRNALFHVPRSAAMMVAATIRMVFAQPDMGRPKEQWRRVVGLLTSGKSIQPPKHDGRPEGSALLVRKRKKKLSIAAIYC